MESQQVGDCNMQEDYDFDRIDLPEVHGALLMELLEDSPADLPEVDDRLNYVIRSLEAEIGGSVAIGDGESTTGPSDDGGLEDMLSDFDSYDGSSPVACVTDGAFDWPEMPVGHDMGGWYVDGEGTEGAIGGYEPREYYAAAAYSYCPEASMEPVYSPLWE